MVFRSLPVGLFFFLVCFSLAGQNVPALETDYTGTTGYLAPVGWRITTQEQNGIYYWMTSKDLRNDRAPAVLVMAMADAPGEPNALIRQVLDPLFESVTVKDSRAPSNVEGHLLLEARSSKGNPRIAATLLRDAANGMLFIAFFAATPADYQALGGAELLYRCLQRPNPFAAVATAPASSGAGGRAGRGIVPDPIAEQFGAGLNLQDAAVQQQILNGSAGFALADLHGEWTQVMSAMTGNVYEEVGSGKLLYGSRGYGHLLKLQPDGSYQLTYSYRNGPGNAADIVEQGTFQLQGTTLLLQASAYSGQFVVNGQPQSQNASRPGTRRFQLGLHASGKYLVMQGKPFEYTIATETDAGGNPLFREGFYRTK